MDHETLAGRFVARMLVAGQLHSSLAEVGHGEQLGSAPSRRRCGGTEVGFGADQTDAAAELPARHTGLDQQADVVALQRFERDRRPLLPVLAASGGAQGPVGRGVPSPAEPAQIVRGGDDPQRYSMGGSCSDAGSVP